MFDNLLLNKMFAIQNQTSGHEWSTFLNENTYSVVIRLWIQASAKTAKYIYPKL